MKLWNSEYLNYITMSAMSGRECFVWSGRSWNGIKKRKKGLRDIAGGIWDEAKEFGKESVNQATGFADSAGSIVTGVNVKSPHGFKVGGKKRKK